MRKLAEKDDIWSAEEKTNGNEKELNPEGKCLVGRTDGHTHRIMKIGPQFWTQNWQFGRKPSHSDRPPHSLISIIASTFENAFSFFFGKGISDVSSVLT